MQSIVAQKILDGFAIAISGMCLLHCLAAPILLLVVPAFATLVADEMVHRLILFLVLPASVVALSFGCRRHKDPIVLLLGASGLLQLIVTAAWGHALFGETGERISTVIASVILSAGHLRNYRLCRRAECCR